MVLILVLIDVFIKSLIVLMPDISFYCNSIDFGDEVSLEDIIVGARCFS
jgi:hypothetical protein